MLWTGGKDSSLALYEARQDGYDVRCLVTFAPEQKNFLAHPMEFLKMQAQALELPHHIFYVTEPFEAGYENHLRILRDMGIGTVITGDIAEVGGAPNWIRERSRPVGMNVHTPLWGRDRNLLLQQLVAEKFKVFFSCIKTRWLTENWIGRELNDSSIADLQMVRQHTGLDLCGEEGEYHTLVADCPMFKRTINVHGYSGRTMDSLAYMEIHESRFSEK